MKNKESTEYVLLGSLMEGPKHGYEIIRFLNAFLKPTWRVSTSQLYNLLKRLERSRLLSSSIEVQDTRPSKRVFKLTAGGRKLFREWLHTPVHLMRDFRIELFGKLFFFHHLALGGSDQLISAQIDVLKEILTNLQRQEKQETDAFRKLIFRYKQKAAHSALNWLRKDAKPFMEKQQNENPS